MRALRAWRPLSRTRQDTLLRRLGPDGLAADASKFRPHADHPSARVEADLMITNGKLDLGPWEQSSNANFTTAAASAPRGRFLANNHAARADRQIPPAYWSALPPQAAERAEKFEHHAELFAWAIVRALAVLGDGIGLGHTRFRRLP